MTFEVLNFNPSLVIKLVQLEVLSPTHKYLLVHVEGGGVGGTGDVHLLQLLKPNKLRDS